MNTKTYCRICLVTNSNLRSLFDSDGELKAEFEACTSINIQNDTFSHFICRLCEAKLICSYAFRNQALESLKTLQESCKANEENLDFTVEATLVLVDDTNQNQELIDESEIKNEPEINVSNEDDYDWNNDDNEGCASSEEDDFTWKENNKGTEKPKHSKRTKRKSQSKTLERICPGCHKTFNVLRDLVHHRKENRDDKNHRYKCFHCNKDFLKKQSLEEHIILHKEGDNRFKCIECNKSYSCIGGLNQHNRLFHRPPSLMKQFPCPTCCKIFRTSAVLDRHIHQVHLKTIKAFCKICNKPFLDNYRLKVHMVQHTGEKPIKCLICSKGFIKNSELQYHMDSVHVQEKKFECDVSGCDRKYKSQKNLNDHKKNHVRGFKFTCSVCGHGFQQRQKFEEHNNIHTGARPYSCDFCQKTFRAKQTLIWHLETHNSNRQKFPCEKCDKVLISKMTYTKHLRTHRNK